MIEPTPIVGWWVFFQNCKPVGFAFCDRVKADEIGSALKSDCWSPSDAKQIVKLLS